MRARHLRSAVRHPGSDAAIEPLEVPVPDRSDHGPRDVEPVAIRVQRLRSRACSLRRRAFAAESALAITYRRRASELLFEAWLLELRAGMPVGEIQAAA